MAEEKPVVEIQEVEVDEFAHLRKSRRRWCIGASIAGILSLFAVIFGIVWCLTHKKYTDGTTPTVGNYVSPYANLTKLVTYDSNSPVATKSRVFVIGDIHGCLDEFNQLLTAINYNNATDQIILAGDVTSKGPDSIGVIRRAQQIGALCVRGNHDDQVIRLKTYENTNGVSSMSGTSVMEEGPVPDPIQFGNKHQNISTNMTDTDYAYLQGCPLILDLPTFNAYVVHGGLNPTVQNMTNQDPYSVMNVRDIDSNGTLDASQKSGVPWSDNWNQAQIGIVNPKYVYYGHAASRGLNLQTYSFGVDSGCVYGRQLTAMELHTHNLTQVNCKKYA
ncbi:Metallo-dependent phosphatase-like protein [Umbelopsis sp. PMI_123]|nr:Metallo-dependent phosphatase-like protein [Umbelopsis sp. PMI_123]